MVKLTMSAALAAVALAWGAPARAADVEKTRQDAQQDVNKTRADAQQDVQKAREKLQKTEADAHAKVEKEQVKANEKVQNAQSDDAKQAQRQDRDTTTRDDRDRTALGLHGKDKDNRHSMFDGKDNWDVKGRVARVSGNSVTLHRDDLPDVTLKTSTGTHISVDGNDRARVSQLRAGQDVRASFNLQGSSPVAVDIKADSKHK